MTRLFSKSRGIPRRKPQGPRQRRRCRMESLERRQLLAAEVLFTDSFESGSNSNDWVGNWVEDSQNDWFRSTQRATEGVRSAEVDGWASNATLTLSTPIDLSGYTSAELTFDWLIERGFDRGEYVALDISSDGGASWTSSVLQLDGNSDPENQWFSETVDLTPFASDSVLIRFRSYVSRSSEDANVDNVRITGTLPSNQAPIADAGEDQTLHDAGGNGDEFVVLSGTGSDADGEIVSYEWKLGDTVIGTTASITPTLPVGTNTLTLTVTDNEGASTSDTVEVTINEVAVKPVKVFIMAGQSNLTGTADANNLDPSWNVPQDDAWIWLDHDMNGGQWTTVAPGHGWSTHAPRPEEPEGLDPRNGLGPELSLARTLADAYPDHQIALIKHGDGGRDLAEHFNPNNPGDPGSSDHMWSGLLKKTDDAFAVLDASGRPYEVEGFFWDLGGGDARNRNSGSSDPAEVAAGEQEALERSAQYGANLTNFISEVRDRYASDLPFVMTRIKDNVSESLLQAYPGGLLVRQGQLDVAASVPRVAAFTGEGLTRRDAVHYDAMGQIGYGMRFADAYLKLVSPPTIDYADFSDTSELNLVFDAAAPAGTDNALHLTPLVNNQRGGAWHTSKQLVSLGFTMTFDFQTTGNGSDGFAFVIQNDAVDAMGGGGGGLGYKNIPNSLALEFDTFQNGSSDPNNNHVSVQTLGTAANSNDTANSVGYVTPSFDINDGNVHQVKVVYQPGTLDVFLDDFSSPALSVPVDLSTTLSLDAGTAWLGFTGVSGGTAQQQAILNWTYTPLADPQATIEIDDAQVVEGDTGTNELVFTVTRSGDTSGSAAVDWTTIDGSATTADYVADSGQIVFLPGETETTISVMAKGDTGEESNETLLVELSAASGAELTRDLAIGTILNDDTSVSISDDTVTEADTDIRFLGEYASATAAQLYQSRGIEFGPDGNVYVSRFDDPAVLRFDGQSGAPMGVFAADPQLTAAKNLEFGPDGNLYVVDNISDAVVRFDGATGAFMDVFVPSGAGGLTTPRGLAFDGAGNLYVGSGGTNQILRYDGSTGSFLNDFVRAGSGGLISPTELTFGGDGHLYVASGAHQGNNSILRYDGATGTFIDTFVSAGNAGLSVAPTGGVLFGQDVNGDGNDDLWVSNRDGDEVLVFDGINGEYLATPVTSGLGGLDDPKGLAFDPNGNLLVVDNGNDRILRYGAASQAAVTVTLSLPSAVSVLANYNTVDGTAVAGDDYTATSGTITFLPGETAKTILVPTLDDSHAENAEQFSLHLANITGAAITDSQATVTILDDGDLANASPLVDAGSDRTLRDSDGTGSEAVVLVGTAADSDGTIASVEWSDGTNVLGNSNTLNIALPVGVHTLTFTATDDEGASLSDTVQVTVTANQAPTANAGADQLLTDTDDNGSEVVTLIGSGSDSDGSIVSYQWTEGATVLGNTASISPTLGVGTHTLTLTVTDNGGATATDTVNVTIEAAPVQTGPNLSHGVVTDVDNNWQTVSFGTSYDSAIVLGTPQYESGSGPGVVRIRNVTATSFEVRVDNVGSSPFSGNVHFVAVEEGVYDEPGFKLEAVKYSEAETSRKNGWLIDSATYQQSYSNPVVVGQVMSANDPDWSVFWASGNSRTSPPSASQLNVGKHVAEDPNSTRVTETDRLSRDRSDSRWHHRRSAVCRRRRERLGSRRRQRHLPIQLRCDAEREDRDPEQRRHGRWRWWLGRASRQQPVAAGRRHDFFVDRRRSAQRLGTKPHHRAGRLLRHRSAALRRSASHRFDGCQRRLASHGLGCPEGDQSVVERYRVIDRICE